MKIIINTVMNVTQSSLQDLSIVKIVTDVLLLMIIIVPGLARVQGKEIGACFTGIQFSNLSKLQFPKFIQLYLLLNKMVIPIFLEIFFLKFNYLGECKLGKNFLFKRFR
ncbi:hypothetical protein PPERSA_01465 [Pseudocohnilembus persalinus]|uniref:Uncharacterized protein n=1 Tax=Pseudocohnilembus persalinus TaxID=266149 RepID=A0A0V0QHE0_PSEPJ|nr:hypothetical protein PPERSA_01465 [Pseudocohnilembus persalinus]|eukprot:KRX01562.1 hypothetical protein PPERSA_01465 [Pseudocohnilembus persalinus]